MDVILSSSPSNKFLLVAAARILSNGITEGKNASSFFIRHWRVPEYDSKYAVRWLECVAQAGAQTHDAAGSGRNRGCQHGAHARGHSGDG
jgi:hypothetical protein